MACSLNIKVLRSGILLRRVGTKTHRMVLVRVYLFKVHIELVTSVTSYKPLQGCLRKDLRDTEVTSVRITEVIIVIRIIRIYGILR
jgi:hypothetical protein